MNPLREQYTNAVNWKGALAGEKSALAELAGAAPGVHDWLEKERILSSVVHRAIEAGIDLPPRWQVCLQRVAVTSLVFARALSSVGAVLDEVGIPWAPIKGMDLRSRLYKWPEERLSSDMDVLIPLDAYDRAVAALKVAGWQSHSEETLLQGYEREEGYNWQAVNSNRVLLELHFRLWRMVAEEFAAEALAAAQPDPGIGKHGLRLSWPFAFIICAVHAWQDPPPYPLIVWWELKKLAQMDGDPAFVEKVITIAKRWGLQLPVAHAAGAAADLWPESPCAQIDVVLSRDLSMIEKAARALSRRHGLDQITWRSIFLARLLSGRPTRQGWRALVRQVWRHPGIVANTTPTSLPWIARRGISVMRALGLNKAGKA